MERTSTIKVLGINFCSILNYDPDNFKSFEFKTTRILEGSSGLLEIPSIDHIEEIFLSNPKFIAFLGVFGSPGLQTWIPGDLLAASYKSEVKTDN